MKRFLLNEWQGQAGGRVRTAVLKGRTEQEMETKRKNKDMETIPKTKLQELTAASVLEAREEDGRANAS